uniref:Putative ovule protein n=1 Tax=Solanum chacoense TaxID=4108 RepID=A0A0V0GPT0_SOLCH
MKLKQEQWVATRLLKALPFSHAICCIFYGCVFLICCSLSLIALTCHIVACNVEQLAPWLDS